MNDSKTTEEIRVITNGTNWPFMMIPVDQLGPIRELLDRNQIEHWVSTNAISLGGGPYVAFLYLVHSEDASQVQAILDSRA
jgi:hypothetical protein